MRAAEGGRGSGAEGIAESVGEAVTKVTGRKGEAAVLAGLPEPLVVEGAAGKILGRLAAGNACVVAVDDDPTGNQSVRDAPILTGWSEEELAGAVRDPARLAFVLTNTRSLPEAEAARINEEIGGRLARVARATGVDVRIVSRSDSTLRGHFPAETDALERGWTAEGGAPADGVVLCPQFFEAGRLVAAGTLWVRDGHDLVPAVETEYARDPDFGYGSSDLVAWAAEKAGVRPSARAVRVGIEDLRLGGPERVAELLSGTSEGSVVAVDAVGYADLEVFALGLLAAEEAGKRFLCRTGPSFLGAVAAKRSLGPLTAREIYGGEAPEGRGLVVVGSHTGLTTRQVEAAARELDLGYVKTDTGALAEEGRHGAEVSRVAGLVEEALRKRDVLLATGRECLAPEGAGEGLARGRRISRGLAEVVRRLDADMPLRYLVAKGGITSHDVAVAGLGVRRARVLGQMQRGRISVWRLGPASLRPGLPYVVFPGNVGEDSTLVDVLRVLKETA